MYLMTMSILEHRIYILCVNTKLLHKCLFQFVNCIIVFSNLRRICFTNFTHDLILVKLFKLLQLQGQTYLNTQIVSNLVFSSEYKDRLCSWNTMHLHPCSLGEIPIAVVIMLHNRTILQNNS